MGFLFAKVMREFGYRFDELLNLGIHRFWFLVATVERLRAEEDLRQIDLMMSVAGGETVKKQVELLQQEMGIVYEWTKPDPTVLRVDPETGLDPEFDRAGLHSLKGKGRLGG